MRVVLVAFLSMSASALLTPVTDQEPAAPPHIEAGKKTKCPERRQGEYCCYSLDYSVPRVECVGPGRVEYFEKCLEYDPRPMCCCDQDPMKMPGVPDYFPRTISCDQDCTVLGLPDDNDDDLRR
ncbi:hypothetical protein GE09DRAFT_1226761 [Coniochaeta sp. 2T2.1]|nr:hypothetical protein GE09DRAFT_1226761 [Coniochaeta sp. 2T2.1]